MKSDEFDQAILEKNMKLTRISGRLGLAAIAVVTSQFAVADDLGWYGGANVGRSAATIDDARITSGLLSRGLTTTSIIDQDRSTGGKIFGGYQFNRNFALEGGYFDLGKFGFAATTVPAGTLTGNIRLQGWNLDAVGILPVTEKLSVLGRVGVTNARARDSFSGTGAVNVPYSSANPSQRDTNYKFGVGVQYAFNDALAMRVEAERYRVNDAVGNKGDVDLVSVGLVYRFGAKVQAPAPREATPEPVAAAPAPEPVAVMPAPAPPTRVTFSADSLFDFDKAAIKPEGRQALDKFAADLKGASFDAITVTGHTDRIGSHDYNMALSTRRAEAVKSYLAESAGIPAGKIAARGMDGAAPVTKPGDCKGNKPTQALIACLQPDRRVEVEVSGTR